MEGKNVIITALILLLLVASPKKTVAATEAAFQVSYLGQSGLPRGIRNNNPGNLKLTSNAWQGKVPADQNSDGVFEQFYRYVDGIRAMIRLVRDSYIKKGYNTIAKIINRYAPAGTPENNNTPAYIAQVVQLSGIPADQELNTNFETLSRVLTAMAFHENGQEAITPDLFAAAWSIA